MMCQSCNGEGTYESEILCPGYGCECDGWSGGCVREYRCDDCGGTGEIEGDEE